MKRTPYVIIGHGGAGGISYPKRRRDGLMRAVSVGYGILTQGGSSLDAVEKAVEILEDTTIFNAGTGSSLNLKGIAEMDASLMTSEQRFGAVAAITNVKNPIKVARLVMEKSDHLLLFGEGAVRFARLMGLRYYNPKTREKMRTWRMRRRDLRSTYFRKLKDIAELYDTVGVVAIDKHGLISAGTSSGGITMRLPGRVGDTPIIGAGTYADKNAAVSTTGHGEAIMRSMLAFRAVSLMVRYPTQTAERRIIEYANRSDCRCGLVGVDKKGNILCANNTKAMSWCSIKNGKMKMFAS